jgi:ribosomal protein S12 methylthiotransferase
VLDLATTASHDPLNSPEPAAEPTLDQPLRIGFVSLGCPKNLVDSEVMMGLLDHAGARIVNDPETMCWW